MKKGEPPEPPETILYVPFTPGSVLKKEIQSLKDTLNTSKFGRVRVLERLGRSVIETIGNKAPWRSEPCSRSQCVPCTTKPGSCRSRNVTYKIVCNTCAKSGQSKIYWGESHRAWADRCQDHVDAVKSGNLAYAIVKHHHNEHGNTPPDFLYKLHRSHRTSLERQITEALLIEHTNVENIMNSRAEWGFNAIPRDRIEVQNDPNHPLKSSNNFTQNTATPELSFNGIKRSNNFFIQNSSRSKIS